MSDFEVVLLVPVRVVIPSAATPAQALHRAKQLVTESQLGVAGLPLTPHHCAPLPLTHSPEELPHAS